MHGGSGLVHRAAAKRVLTDDVTRVPLVIGTWVVRAVVAMREVAFREHACPPTTCAACDGGMEEAPVQWLACGCWTCEACYWRGVAQHFDVDRRRPLPDAEPACPLCATPVDPNAHVSLPLPSLSGDDTGEWLKEVGLRWASRNTNEGQFLPV